MVRFGHKTLSGQNILLNIVHIHVYTITIIHTKEPIEIPQKGQV